MIPNRDETDVKCFHGFSMMSLAVISYGDLFHGDVQSPTTNTIYYTHMYTYITVLHFCHEIELLNESSLRFCNRGEILVIIFIKNLGAFSGGMNRSTEVF